MEEDFPRGHGKKRPASDKNIKAKKPVKKHKSNPKDEDKLFRETSPVPVKQSMIKLREDEKKLLPELVATGMLVLGCVAEVREFELTVSLPHGLSGTVGITDVCNAYKHLLEQLTTTESDESFLNSVPSLDDLFYVGKLVRCKVTNVTVKGRKKLLSLSLNPADVNSEVKSFNPGMVLTGCVSSCEDHGYVVDIGVRNTTAFLKMAEAEKYMQALGDRGRLFVGSYFHCLIGTDIEFNNHSGEKRVVNVIADPDHIQQSELEISSGIKLHSLLPGTVGIATVIKVLKDYVLASFLSYTGLIHMTHLKLPLEKYESKQEVKVTLLYIDPVSKILALSELKHLTKPEVVHPDELKMVAVGSVIKDAVVVNTDARRGIHLRLPDKQKAFASIQDLPASFPTKSQTKFKKGTTHRCRVIKFNVVDRLVIVSLKKRALNQLFLSYDDVKPGTVVECRVRSVHQGGISVDVGHSMYGFIPSLQVAEMPLKHPEKKFIPGKKLRCKVLYVDSVKQKLLLTHKKSLLESQFDPITSYADCRIGQIAEGCIVSIKPAGAVVLFYNNVKGFIPRRELTEQPVDFPERLYFLGQVVKCRILTCNPEEEKMRLSLRIGRSNRTSAVGAPLPDGLSFGQIVSCRVVKVSDNGLNVQLDPSGVDAFLPQVHLSDHSTNYALLLSSYSEGDVIDRVVFIGRSGNVIVSKKQSLLKASSDDALASTFSDLKLGMLVTGVLKRKMEYGVFVDLLNGLTGLAPNKFLLDSRHPAPASVFQEGQSLVAKIIEVNDEKQRFLVSVRMSDCYHGDSELGVQLLSNFLSEYSEAIERLKARQELSSLLQLKVGQVVGATVLEVTEDGVLCILDDGVKGFVTVDHMPGIVCKADDQLSAVVLHIDPVANCVQLTLHKEVVKTVRNLNDNKYSQVRLGQKIKSEVQLVTDDFVLVLLKGHAAGRFAYLPAKKHLNDVLEKNQFIISQVNNVVIKSDVGDFIVANLEIHETVAARTDDSGVIIKQRDMPSIGTIAVARVTKVFDLQLYVSVNGFAGRVYITEIVDDPSKDDCPVAKYKIGSELKVKIIGYRQLKANKYLPISHADRAQVLLECSARPSKLSSDAVEFPLSLNIGDRVPAYVSSHVGHLFWLQITSEKRGKLHILNASNNLKILQKAADNFKVGQGHWVKIIGRGNKASEYEVTIVDRENEIKPGLVVPAIVLSVIKGRGLHLQLPCNQVGDVHLTDLSDEYVDDPLSSFAVNQFVTCSIVKELSGARRKWAASLRLSRVSAGSADVKDSEVSSLDELSAGDVRRGFVIGYTGEQGGVLVSFSCSVIGKVAGSELSGCSDLSAVYPIGKLVTCKIKTIHHDSGHIDLSLVDEPVKIKKQKKRKVSVSAEVTSTESKKSKKVTTAAVGTGQRDATEATKQTENHEQPCLYVPFTWDTSSTSLQKDGDDSDSGYECTEKSAKTKVKEDREKKLFEAEMRLLQTDAEPQTVDDFERLVIQSPDSSMCWIRYAASHIATANLDGARAVFERALQTISCREEQERLNVWLSYINMAILYCTHSDVDAIYVRALKNCDQLSLQRGVITLYIRAGKNDMADKMYKTVLVKHKSDPTVWIGYATLLYSDNRLDDGRNLLNRAMLSVEKKRHADLSCKWAQLELKYGTVERAKALFECIVTNTPRRTDIWSVYIDALIKYGDTNYARSLFDRVTSLRLPPKPLTLFMQRFLEFERKYGTSDSVEAVKKKAVNICEQTISEQNGR